MRANFITAAQAAALVHDGATISSVGMTLCGVAESIFKALESSFLETGSPRDLTFVHSPDSATASAAFSISATKACSSASSAPLGARAPIMEMIASEKVEATTYRRPACATLPLDGLWPSWKDEQGRARHVYRSPA